METHLVLPLSRLEGAYKDVVASCWVPASTSFQRRRQSRWKMLLRQVIAERGWKGRSSRMGTEVNACVIKRSSNLAKEGR